MGRLKRLISPLLALCALSVLCAFSSAAAQGAREGLRVCASALIPSLFPFFVLSGLLRASGLTSLLARTAAPLMGALFGVSGAGATALALGLCGGYPLGAAAVSNLVRDGEVCPTEGEKLLVFCNNSGPGFILGAAGAGAFGSLRAGLLLFSAHILGAVTVGVLLSGLPPKACRSLPRPVREPPPCSLPDAVRDAALAMLSVCGFVVLFSAICGILDALYLLPRLSGALSAATWLPLSAVRALLIGTLELGGGVAAMQGLSPNGAGLSICAFILGWGGLSVHLQTAAVTSGTGMKTARHTVGRLLCGICSAMYIQVLFALL